MQKALKRGLLDFLQTRFGIILLICGVFYCINTGIGLLQALVESDDQPASSGIAPQRGCVNCAQQNYADTLGSSQHAYEYDSTSSSSSPSSHYHPSYESTLCFEPIDIVYTWVNGSDPQLQKDLKYWKKKLKMVEEGEEDEEEEVDGANAATQTIATPPTSVPDLSLANATATNASSTSSTLDDGDSSSSNRFRDNQELRYSLRSIWKYAPWVRHVFIVTNGHVPYWLNLNHPRITLVSHEDIFPNKSHLPTFSSPAIESHLHRIPGIAKKFIYFNDDVLLGNHITPDDFVTHGQGQKIFLSWNVPNCATGCPDTWLGDGYCDKACNVKSCQWDEGDCVNNTLTRGGKYSHDRPRRGRHDGRYKNWETSRGASPPSTTTSSGNGANARYCSSSCPNNWVGDKVCDRACKNIECAFDGGDCGIDLIRDGMVGIDLPRLSATNGSTSSDPNTVYSPNITYSYHLPYHTVSLYVNLSAAFPGATLITQASHDNSLLIRSAIVTQNLKVLTLILFDEEDVEEEEEVRGGASGSEENGDIVERFDEAMGSKAAPSPSASSSAATGTPSNTTTEDSTTTPLTSNTTATTTTTPTTSTTTTPATPAELPPRRVEIYIQGELNGVLSNFTFNLTRARFPTPEELAQLNAPDEDEEEEATRSSTNAASSTNATATATNTTTSTSSGSETASTSDSDSAATTESPTATLATNRRHLSSVFDSIVHRLKGGAGGKVNVTHLARLPPVVPAEPVPDPDSPYNPPAGYSHTNAYTSSPSSATRHGSADYASASYHLDRMNRKVNDRPHHSSWRDLPVFIESVPISDDIIHSGVKLRSGGGRRGRDRKEGSREEEADLDDLWHSVGPEIIDDTSSSPSSSSPSSSSSSSSHNTLHDSTGRVIESYGWSSRDYELAQQIIQHKQKQLWLLEREIARNNFMTAWRLAQRERRRVEQEGESHGSTKGSHLPSAASHDDPQSSVTRTSFSRDPLWPWELNAAAPELFEEWDWAEESKRFAKYAEERARSRRERKRRGRYHAIGSTEKQDETTASSSPSASNINNNNNYDGFEFELEGDGNDGKSDDGSIEYEIGLFGDIDSTENALRSSVPTTPAAVSSLSSSSSSDTGDLDSPLTTTVDLTTPSSGPRRTLLDVYGDSLRFVNTLYTTEFGRETRKAPAHMPHMIDTRIESELQDRWPHLFDATSSHRFRHSSDMQYSFSYFYYLMNLPRVYNFTQIWNEQLDLNHDGVLSQLEIRYMTLWLSGKKILEKDLTKMYEKLMNATRLIHNYPYETYNITDPPLIDQSVLLNCTDIIDLIEDKWTSHRQYRYELINNLNEIEFYMVPDNTTKVQLRLDEIRTKMPKFICLNDDMNKTHSPPAETLKVLNDFYLSYFPIPCPFENKEEEPNQFMYVKEWRQRQAEEERRNGQWNIHAIGTWMKSAFKSSSITPSSSSSSHPPPRLLYWTLVLLTLALLYLLQQKYHWYQRAKRVIMNASTTQTKPHTHVRTATKER